MNAVNSGGTIPSGGGSPEATLYDILGVPETASAEEIKRAYYRLVRQYRPSEHPDIFQKFNEASRTLGDARRRGEYDQNRRSGRRVQILLDQAAAALDKDTQKAVTLLKSAIALAPDMPRPRYLLAHTLIKAGEYAGAEKQYRWLIKETPRDETLRFKLARCLFLQKRYPDAEEELRTTLRLNPRYHDALMLGARLYEAAGQIDWAIDALERAVSNDDKENYADVDALLRLFVLYLQTDNHADVERTARRLSGVIPSDDPERATRAARRLYQRAADLADGGEERYDLAAGLLAVAGRVPNVDDDDREEVEALARRVELAEEAKKAVADPLLEGALKDCLFHRYLDKSADNVRKPKLDATLTAVQAEIISAPRELGRAVEYLRREYPKLAADQSAFLQELVTRVVRRLEIIGPAPKGEGAVDVMPGNPAGAAEAAPAPADDPAGARAGQKRGLLGWLRGGKG